MSEIKHPGEVTSVSIDNDGKHVRVSVAHGPKKKPSKRTPWDDRPTSNVVLPQEAAEAYNVGDKVFVCLEMGEAGEDLDDMQRRLRKGRE